NPAAFLAMKIRTLTSACFAGIGIYYILTGSVTLVISLSMITTATGSPFNQRMVLLQALAYSIPFIIGLIFLIFAPKLAGIVCRFAKIEDDEISMTIRPETIIMAGCVVSGLIVAIGQIPEIVQLATKQFLTAASSDYALQYRGEDFRVIMIRPGVHLMLAFAVIWKARAIASWLVSHYEKT
ncbi:hypothetical protein N9Z12_02540, partial [Opitutaceae bacterium]|nr:hypothetical protein [Opitutaceae bacterium]